MILRLLPLLAFVILCSPFAAAQPPPRDILARTAETYRSLRQYQMEGTISVRMQGALEQAMDITVRLAGREPGHTFFELVSPLLQMTYVAVGDTSWIYLPARKQYMKQAGLLMPSRNAPDLLGSYKTIDTRAAAVHVVGEARVDVGGEERPSYVLTVEYATPSPGGTDSTSQTLWIDKERLLVLKDASVEHLGTSPLGGTMLVRKETLFSRVEVAVPPPDSLFAFTPPAGAREVNTLDLFGPAEASLRGHPARAFTLPGLAGEPVSLETLRGKVVLINFWATWCGPCRSEMAALDRLHRDYADQGLVVLAVDLEEPQAAVEAFIDEHGFTFPVLLDSDGAVAASYNAFSIPTTFVIDRQGKIAQHLVGARSESALRSALKEAGLE